jgi:uncharacterized protein YeeX (DUF496 family)
MIENEKNIKTTEYSESTSIKKLLIPSPVKSNSENHKKTVEKTLVEKKKRVETASNQWTYRVSNLSIENQWDIIQQLHGDLSSVYKTDISVGKILDNHCQFASKEIQRKINGYKSQDIDKKILDETKFATFKNVIDLLFQVNNKCFYCKENVAILYEYVREPKQWTLDRLDNDFGHNHDNVVIACLSCNLRRKTMYHERFVFTKQLHIVKKA